MLPLLTAGSVDHRRSTLLRQVFLDMLGQMGGLKGLSVGALRRGMLRDFSVAR